MQRRGGGTLPVVLIIAAIMLVVSLVAYWAAYVSLSAAADVTLPSDSTPRRFRRFNHSWQTYMFLPASAVETMRIGRPVTLVCDDGTGWQSYPALEP